MGLVVLAAGCARSRNEVIVGLVTDIGGDVGLPSLDQIDVKISRNGDVVATASPHISWTPNVPFRLPGTWAIYTDDGTTPEIDIDVKGLSSGAEIVEREASFRLPLERTAFVRLGLTNACGRRPKIADRPPWTCPGGFSCVEGRCVAQAIDVAALPDFQPGLIDTLACGATAYLDSNDALPLNVGGRCPAGEHCREGLCYPDKTFAPVMVWIDGRSGAVEEWTMAGQGATAAVAAVTSSGALPAGAVGIVLADFNGDGDSDILWMDAKRRAGVLLLVGGSAAWTGQLHPGVETFWDFVGAADFSGDGYVDAMWRDTDTGLLGDWWINDTASIWNFDYPTTTIRDFTQTSCSMPRAGCLFLPADLAVLGAGDFNGDRYGDLLVRSNATGDVQVMLNGRSPVAPDGTGMELFSSPTTVQPLGTDWDFVAIADYDGDGRSDVFWRNRASQMIMVWRMDGSKATARLPNGMTGVDATWKVEAAGDIDGDGRAELLFRDGSGVTHVWWMAGGAVESVTTLAPRDGEFTLLGIGRRSN
jgi:hypothetical protein